MKKLFVIGNGFDSAHKLPTTYDDFRKYLCNTYMNGRSGNDFMPIIPSVSMGPKGEEICNMEEVAEFLVYIISMAEPDGDKWSELEASLGRLDYDEAFDMLPTEYDKDGDPDYWKELYNNEDMASNLYSVISYIKDLFSEWVDTIDIDAAVVNRNFQRLIGSTDLFLTFNYTETLESLYGVESDRVSHIHGKQGADIFFGHGNDDDYSDEYMRRNIGSESDLAALDRLLRKDTGKAFRQNKDFFQRIGNDVTEVYSMGFSFGAVDLIYIREICKRLPDDAIWYLNDYDPAAIPEYERCLRECGFKGVIGRFSC